VEGARAAAVSDYQASEAFEAFKKQAKEKYPDVDFSEFQSYDDMKSVNDDRGGMMVIKKTMLLFSFFCIFYEQLVYGACVLALLFYCMNGLLFCF
jgi:hypothetical protein